MFFRPFGLYANLFLLLVVFPTSWLKAEEIAEHEAVVGQEFIFTEAPFRECHASTIAQLPDGSLVAAWFGGTKEKDPDVGIWVSRQVDGKWTKPVEVANGIQKEKDVRATEKTKPAEKVLKKLDEALKTLDGKQTPKRYPCWNPVLFQPRRGPLMLFFKVGPNPREWWGEMMISEDGGQTWKDRRRLPDGFIGPVKNKPIEVADGSIWCPSSTEDKEKGWRVHIEIIPDQGTTWRKIGPIGDKKFNAIQPSLLYYGGGKQWQMLCRDKRLAGSILQVWSEDGGRTWSEFTETDLPNPSSGTDAVTLADGRQLLVYNHTIRTSGPFTGREMLNVAFSADGKKWMIGPTLEKRPGWEFSYPAVIQTRDGLVHIVYTWGRKRIKHVTLDPKEL